jgi:hypothetical protein
MKPRPFYRWKSFWLGILVLLFLGWAWRDSMRFETLAQVAGPIGKFEVSRLEGTTFVYERSTGFSESELSRQPRLTTAKVMAGNLSWAGIRCFRVRDVPVFLSFLALWSAWLFWHWKREQKEL